MKYFSMFSGIGGFEYGIQRAFDVSQKRRGQEIAQGGNEKGERLYPLSSKRTSTASDRNNEHTDWSINQRQPNCVGYSEIDKYAIKVYERHFGGHKNYGDATKINPTELPDFDLLVGGFPCQAFSIAGKRKGFDDTRGTLFFDIARILAEKKPKHLVLENVKGLLSHDQGRTFQTIIGILADLGYGVEWQVLNSKDFGVPQNRERIIIVGHLGECCGRKVFPIIGSHNPLTQEYVGAIGTPRLERDSHLSRGHKQPARVYADSGISPTLSSQESQGRYNVVRQPLRFLNRNQKNIEGDYAYTVDASQTSGVRQDTRIRRLTPKECERLQGFPDDWTKYGIGDELISDSQRYKMCGNAVTTNVIQAVMEQLL